MVNLPLKPLLSTSTLLDKEAPNDLNPDSCGKFKLLPIMVYNNKVKIISLHTLVPNSRDRHEKNGDQILYITKYTLKYALFEKSRLKCTSNTINNIAMLSTSKNPNSSTSRRF